MKIAMHGTLAEIISTEVLVKNGADMLQLFMDIAHSQDDTHGLILQQRNITPDFFVLSTGVAGEVAQKLVNYDFKAAIIGDFSEVESKSLQAFMLESNKARRLVFASNVGTAITRLGV